jgi:hypothetical protein
MKLRTKLVATTVTLGLLGGASVAAAESPSTEATRGSVALTANATSSSRAATGSQPSVDSGAAAPARALVRNRVGLRSVRPCVFRGTPTTCVIRVRRLERRFNRVVAFGTITPRSNPGVHIPFHKRVVGVRTAGGIVGFQAPQQVPAPTCDILSLVLGPLHLDVLGLVIDLNRVILNITGQTGAGNLLGNLLCGLVGILDGGLILGRFLSVVDELLAAINAVLQL